jgi:hypothetical protein
MPVETMMQPMPGQHYLYPGCEALTDIISFCYFIFRSNSTTGYSTRLPECAFAYYCAVVCYWRLLYLQLNNGLELTNSEVSFVHQLKSMHLHVPQLFGHYLSGFGNTTIPFGRDVKFRMRKVPSYYNAGNTTGWFGRVSADTQPFYQNYPCLAVYVTRMFASLEGGEWKNIWWNFPAEIQPIIAGGLGPSPACIGYGPRENLSSEQRNFLEANGVLVGEQFPSSNRALPINTNLLFVINRELRAQSGLQLLPLPETLIGTVGQICFTAIEGGHEERTTRASPMTLMSTFLVPGEASLCASAFAYRVHHAVDEAAQEELPQQPWVVWRFGGDAPADWAQLTAAGNSFREGEPKILSYTMFRTTPYLIRSQLELLNTSLSGKIY